VLYANCCICLTKMAFRGCRSCSVDQAYVPIWECVANSVTGEIDGWMCRDGSFLGAQERRVIAPYRPRVHPGALPS
jgi:hypothetical protein